MTILDIALFATADADWSPILDEYLSGAKYHLQNFDIQLNIYPRRPDQLPVQLPLIQGPVHDRPPDFGIALLPGDLRAAAHVALPTPHGMPVILCRFHRSDAGLTVFTADTGANRGVSWLNYVLIHADGALRSRTALVHELIHAANYSGDIDPFFGLFLHDSDPTSMMTPTVGPGVIVSMHERHAAALRNAYFARTV